MTTIYDQFTEQRRNLARKYMTPSCVVFSQSGHKQAMRENIHSQLFMPALSAGGRATYGGLPYSIIPDQEAAPAITVLAELPSPPAQRAIRFAMRGMFGKLDAASPPKTMVEVVAQSLDAATLCDIIRTWLDSEDATQWGDFEKALDRAVVEHGRFE